MEEIINKKESPLEEVSSGKQDNKWLYIVIAVLFVMVLGVGGYIVYDRYSGLETVDDADSTEDEPSTADRETEVEENADREVQQSVYTLNYEYNGENKKITFLYGGDVEIVEELLIGSDKKETLYLKFLGAILSIYAEDPNFEKGVGIGGFEGTLVTGKIYRARSDWGDFMIEDERWGYHVFQGDDIYTCGDLARPCYRTGFVNNQKNGAIGAGLSFSQDLDVMEKEQLFEVADAIIKTYKISTLYSLI